MRRGACPGLSAPLPTGDGLLVRLQAIGTVPPAAVADLCAAARKHGNGAIEVTSRGNIQVRGLSPHSVPAFAADVAAIDIGTQDGIAVLCNPLAGLDADEIIDVAAFAAALRRALARQSLAARLSPKVSIVIDGGGAFDPAEIPADIRLSARLANDAKAFHVAVGGDEAGATPLGVVAHHDAVEAATRLLEVLASRGRDIRARDVVASDGAAAFGPAMTGLSRSDHPSESGHTEPIARSPIGLHRLRDGSFACGVGLAFGHCEADDLQRLAVAARNADAAGFRPAPGRALLAVGLAFEAVPAFVAAAAQLYFIVRADDPRRRVIACAGAPICGAAHIAARALAPDIAASAAPFIDGAFAIHVSGCVKGCAHPKPAALTVVGTPEGCALVANGSTRDAAFATVPAKDLTAAIARIARAQRHEDSHV